jgi:hypothetical protein
MNQHYSLIGPDVFMDSVGKLYKKASDKEYIRIKNKYTDAEDRYVESKIKKKGRE